MTTDANAPAALVPTREEIAKEIDHYAIKWWREAYDFEMMHSANPDEAKQFADWSHGSSVEKVNAKADRIIARYAPALARLEQERDEARAVEDQAVGRLQDVLSEAEAALATAEAEGMRKAAGIAHEYWTAVIAGHGHVPADPIEAMTKAAQEIEAAILWQTARPK